MILIKKLNNSGMTLVELLVTFSLVMIMAIGIFNLVLEVRKDLDEKEVMKNYTTYSNDINNKIHYDLIRNKPFVITYKNSETDIWFCKYSDNSNCNVTNDILSVTYKNKSKDSSSLNSLCTIYPCAIYGYLDKNNEIDFKAISINKNIDNTNKKYGIKYNDTFESVPDEKDIDFKKDDTKIEIDDKGFFVINISFFMKGNNRDFGFKIAYPFIKQVQ